MIYEDEVDRLLESGEYMDAEELLISKIPNAKKRFDRLCMSMRKFLIDIQDVFPDAEYYTGGGGFNLLIGRSHDDSKDCSPQQQRLALSSVSLYVGDGDW